MKRTLALGLLSLLSLSSAEAGGLLNNTSMHARYLRSLARNASTAIDATYYNPAGLVFTPDGWRFSLNSQTVLQQRDIEATFAPFAYNGGQQTKRFEGKATAPILPTLMAAYKQGNWAFSAVVGVFGGGGKASFGQGLPVFEGQVAAIPATTQALTGLLANPALAQLIPAAVRQQLPTMLAPLTGVNQYRLDSQLEGLQYTLGLQLGASYKITDYLSAHLGARISYAYNTYSGHIGSIQVNKPGTAGEYLPAPAYFALVDQGLQSRLPALQPLLGSLPAAAQASVQTVLGLPKRFAEGTKDKQIEVKQTGLGIAPIIGLHFQKDGWDIGARYEFRTALTVRNKTKHNGSGMAQFDDGVDTPNDLPAALALGVSYRVLPSLTASVGFNHFFEKQAHMAGGKEALLKHNTSEYLFGLEWRAKDWLELSAGLQLTRKGVTDDYQSNLHFDMSSNSYGLGAGIQLTKELQLNLAYMFTDYRDHQKEALYIAKSALTPQGVSAKERYTRKNQIFSIGIDYTL